MLRVPVRSTIQASIEDFFISSRLDGPNQRYCGVCGINQDASTEVSLVKPPDLLIVHLVRFTHVGTSNLSPWLKSHQSLTLLIPMTSFLS